MRDGKGMEMAARSAESADSAAYKRLTGEALLDACADHKPHEDYNGQPVFAPASIVFD